jgi:hypothetical protein
MVKANDGQAKGDQVADAQPNAEVVDATTTQGSEQATTESATPGASDEQVHGIATKSGKGVLPYRVLTEARQEASEAKAASRSLAAQLAEAQRQLEEARAASGQQQSASADAPEEITDDEIAAVEADFPAMAKAMRVARRAAQAAAASPTPTAQTGNTQQEDADERVAAVEQAMAGNTLLLRARQQGGVLWGRACEIDAQLRQDPRFADVPAAARFAQVNAALAKELGVSPAPVRQNTAATAPHIDPIRLNTTSDLIGGTAPGSNEAFGPNASGMAMANRMKDMTPQQLDALIRRSG